MEKFIVTFIIALISFSSMLGVLAYSLTHDVNITTTSVIIGLSYGSMKLSLFFMKKE